ncbi:GNAT family N-acetyltransferase [Leisingera sp. M527]|uniref:GNAT family N-acetyltransferase n=1 Tax=Leisingera sp. M527 TaxID=2867014 RepID=UPI0021A95744|nr:GNAT family N-acetyltransferase [Leisingera sp. M527]UWQ33452.1 GNAT family N-acetyltransferase [Leisingera sp. M527]
MTPPVLETDRLILRPHRVQDFADVAALWANPETVRFIQPTVETPEGAWAKLMFHHGHWQAMGFGVWVITERGSGQYLGETGFFVTPRQCDPLLGDAVEASWVLAPEAQGQGIAAEAVLRTHAWADTAGLWPETVCLLDPENTASQKLAAKTGYEFRQKVQYRGGTSLVMARKTGQPGTAA